MQDLGIGDRIQLKDGIDRFFGQSEHGEIRSFFTAPLGDINGIHYAEIKWDDGSISSVPIHTLEVEDIGDDVIKDFLYSDADFMDDVEDFEW